MVNIVAADTLVLFALCSTAYSQAWLYGPCLPDLPAGDAEAILLEVSCTQEGVEVIWSVDRSDWAVDIFTLQFSCTDPLSEEQNVNWKLLVYNSVSTSGSRTIPRDTNAAIECTILGCYEDWFFNAYAIPPFTHTCIPEPNRVEEETSNLTGTVASDATTSPPTQDQQHIVTESVSPSPLASPSSPMPVPITSLPSFTHGIYDPDVTSSETTPRLKTTAAMDGLLPHTRDSATPASSLVPLASNSEAAPALPSTCIPGEIGVLVIAGVGTVVLLLLLSVVVLAAATMILMKRQTPRGYLNKTAQSCMCSGTAVSSSGKNKHMLTEVHKQC